jgi:hypothetical protein
VKVLVGWDLIVLVDSFDISAILPVPLISRWVASLTDEL